jgi:hypothetical protein
MSPVAFRLFQERVLVSVGARPESFAAVAARFIDEPGGNGESDAKAALFGLKAQSRVDWNDDGVVYVRRTNGNSN